MMAEPNRTYTVRQDYRDLMKDIEMQELKDKITELEDRIKQLESEQLINVYHTPEYKVKGDRNDDTNANL